MSVSPTLYGGGYIHTGLLIEDRENYKVKSNGILLQRKFFLCPLVCEIECIALKDKKNASSYNFNVKSDSVFLFVSCIKL